MAEEDTKLKYLSNQIALTQEIINPKFENMHDHINRDINNSNLLPDEAEIMRFEGNLIMHYGRIGFDRMLLLHTERIGMLTASSRGRGGFERQMQVSSFAHQSFKENKPQGGIFGMFKPKEKNN